VFNKLPALALPKPADLGSEVDRYLSSDVKHVTDPLAWWHARRSMYPQLSQMALDYLSIPGKFISDRLIDRFNIFTATSIDVERLFSRSRLLLSHVCSHLSVQSTHALLCLGMWSECNLVMDDDDDDVKTVSELQDVEGNEELELEDGWDHIIIK